MSASRRPIRASAGFTLVELTVALVAGLIVALGIVGLSREATRTFHEEMRSSSAEATLRVAVDRLRGDLKRAAYMSTANITTDPLIAHAPGATNVAGVTGAMLGVLRLAGIHLISGGSLLNTQTLSQLQSPALNPDAIEIGGNMTCAEQFEVQTITDTAGGCKRLTLSANSPALYRVMAVGAAAQAKELQNLFQPDGNSRFMVRLLDDTGRSQYLATCNELNPAGFVGGTAYVDTDNTNTPIKQAKDTKTMGGVGSLPGGRAWVNPVQIVRWEITNASKENLAYQQGLDKMPTGAALADPIDPNKYDLVRTYVDALDAPIGPTQEVVAEYAVDLNFAFSRETGTGTTPNMVTYSFDDTANNQAAANDVSTVAGTRPQQIRVVRARLVTRAAQADRTVTVPVTPGNYAAGSGTQAFLYRYCLVAPCTTADSTLRWARTRTITTEVALPNQEGAYFQ